MEDLIIQITASVMLLAFTAALITLMFMIGLEKAKLEKRKINLEIKKLEQDIENNEEKIKFINAQAKLMEKKAK